MKPFRLPAAALQVSAAAMMIFIAGCASSGAFYKELDESITRRQYPEAIRIVEANRPWYGDKSSVLYHLDAGLLHHYAGNPDSSISHLLAAETEIGDLYTKSITQQAASFLLNDNVLPYEGEDFEKVLLNVFLALDYAEKGMHEDALVEARKVDEKLREYGRKYDGKNTYREDAFIRYIMGALYESDGEVNDAFISYRNAFETYQTYGGNYGTATPSFLLDDLVRTATLTGFPEEAARYDSLGGRWEGDSEGRKGSILILLYAGKSPVKIEKRTSVSIPDTSAKLHTFQIALPEFVPRYLFPREYVASILSHADTTTRRLETAEDITAIAGKDLSDRLTMIYLKSGGRALLKFLASEKLKSGIAGKGDDKAKNFLGSLAVDLFVGATEQADVRSWRTLPARIELARFEMKPGRYTCNVRDDGGGSVLHGVEVTVKPGSVSFVIVDDLR